MTDAQPLAAAGLAPPRDRRGSPANREPPHAGPRGGVDEETGSAATAPGADAAYTHFCNEPFPPSEERGRCQGEAAQGTGPSFVCGPAAEPGHRPACGSACCSAGEG